ncbi:hypothetical protein WL10_09295 [Burkholderia ubonensis]|nr:hypothetical protein WJ73_27800 [Burkholderia ubonensis]KVO42634.1 hypothetical protein WJ75_04775 [Burkholderia ubonensis]KVX93867.1 hypothetical protein WL10_09295 [Burkholderia ubonensis]KWE33869.1 hypothetical protein WL75_29255 [Burkholderia ubonensis]
MTCQAATPMVLALIFQFTFATPMWLRWFDCSTICGPTLGLAAFKVLVRAQFRMVIFGSQEK